jgi:hypothetical protein
MKTWVEIHTHLFPRNAAVRTSGVFARGDLAGQIVDSEFFGRRVHRLTPELQLVYLASTWVRDLSDELDISRVVPLLDAIYLLRAHGPRLDLGSILQWVNNEAALASAHLLLTYLARHRLSRVAADPRVIGLRSAQRTLGTMELRILHTLVDRYVLEGRCFPGFFHSSRLWDPLLTPHGPLTKLLLIPWNLVFPRGVPHRYSLGFHLQRVPQVLRRSWKLLR